MKRKVCFVWIKAQIIANAGLEYIKAKYSLWLIDDSGDEKAIAEAKEKTQTALKESEGIKDL